MPIIGAMGLGIMNGLNLLFLATNSFVLPFWGAMIFLPNWSLTRRVMGSVWPFIPLALSYIVVFAQIPPEVGQAFSSGQLPDLAAAFSDERVAALGWIHFLTFDLFVGRWIYLEGQRTGLWTGHSLALCLFAGPAGLLVHLATRVLFQQFFPARLKPSPPNPEFF